MHEIKIVECKEEFSNCGICHERDTSKLVEVHLPVVVLTLCNGCLVRLGNVIKEEVSK